MNKLLLIPIFVGGLVFGTQALAHDVAVPLPSAAHTSAPVQTHTPPRVSPAALLPKKRALLSTVSKLILAENTLSSQLQASNIDEMVKHDNGERIQSLVVSTQALNERINSARTLSELKDVRESLKEIKSSLAQASLRNLMALDRLQKAEKDIINSAKSRSSRVAALILARKEHPGSAEAQSLLTVANDEITQAEVLIAGLSHSFSKDIITLADARAKLKQSRALISDAYENMKKALAIIQ